MDSEKGLGNLVRFGRWVVFTLSLSSPSLCGFCLALFYFFFFFEGRGCGSEAEMFFFFCRDGCPEKKYEGTNGVAAFVEL